MFEHYINFIFLFAQNFKYKIFNNNFIYFKRSHKEMKFIF